MHLELYLDTQFPKYEKWKCSLNVDQRDSSVRKNMETLRTEKHLITPFDAINQFVLIYEESLNGLMG